VSVFKFRHETQGGHVHVSVFVAKAEGYTFAKSGDLVFSAGREFDEFKHIIIDGGDPTLRESLKPGVIIEERQL
jgi:hypothetical protein